jgi:hypothetical protein
MASKQGGPSRQGLDSLRYAPFRSSNIQKFLIRICVAEVIVSTSDTIAHEAVRIVPTFLE